MLVIGLVIESLTFITFQVTFCIKKKQVNLFVLQLNLFLYDRNMIDDRFR